MCAVSLRQTSQRTPLLSFLLSFFFFLRWPLITLSHKRRSTPSLSPRNLMVEQLLKWWRNFPWDNRMIPWIRHKPTNVKHPRHDVYCRVSLLDWVVTFLMPKVYSRKSKVIKWPQMDSCTFKKIPSLMDFSRFPKYCTSIMNDISPFSVKKTHLFWVVSASAIFQILLRIQTKLKWRWI